MSQPVRMADGNQFDVLATPQQTESKGWETARAGKDDIKQQMHSAKEGVKAKASQLQEQVIGAIDNSVQMAKQKFGAKTGDASVSSKSNAELVDDASAAAQEGWQTVKRKGRAQVEKAEGVIDENLTPAQKQKLKQGINKAKQGALKADRQARGLLAPILNLPQMRGVRSIVHQYHLELPLLVVTAILTLWVSLSLIRLATAPTKVPEFDIHDKDATLSWLKYHAGEYKDKAVETQHSLASRAAAFLANHEFGKMKDQAAQKAIDWREIGMKKLGLQEPTMTQKIWAWATGRPMTWQDRVESVLSDARSGITKVALLHKAADAKDSVKSSVKDVLGLHEPTLSDKLKYYMLGHQLPTYQDQLKAHALEQAMLAKDSAGGIYDSIKGTLSDSYDSIRAHLPGGQAALEEARRKAYEATHQSTLDKVKSTAEYVKNRIVHGSQEAAHIAQDRANEAMDKAKYKTGL